MGYSREGYKGKKERVLEILQWAHLEGCTWNEYLQWARQEGWPWSVTTCSGSAAERHLDILRWARQEGCAWSVTTCSNAAAEPLF